MTKKLTLSVDEKVIRQAKKYANETGNSLSGMIESYLRTITEQHPNGGISIKLKGLVGSVRLPKGFDEEKTLRNYLNEKYK